MTCHWTQSQSALQVLCNLWTMSLIAGVEQYICQHLGWQSVTMSMSVAISVECLSRVGQFISQVAFYCWLRVGQVLVNILMDCHCNSIGRVSAMYQWTISRVWVRYWWCIGWQSVSPVQFFFPTSSLRLFSLLQGTCQLTHGRHYCLLHIFAAADTGLIRYQIMGYFHVSAWHLGCLSVAVWVAISDKYQASVSWESTKVLAIMTTKYWSMVC